MLKKLIGISYAFIVIGLLISPNALANMNNEPFSIPRLEKQLSEDGKTLYNGIPTAIYKANPNPSQEPIYIPPQIDSHDLAQTATATFSITYIPAGEKDYWDSTCLDFPESAKAAFNASVAIWGNIIKSSEPITIKACWAPIGDFLGFAGGEPTHKDFRNAPKSNTWYSAALANSLAGYDIDPSRFDMHITHNSKTNWYFGTDGKPGSDQQDLMSTMLHEICHGLNFGGTAEYSSTTDQGSLGTDGSFNIYDTFMKDGEDKPLTDYTTPSTELGNVLKGGNLWFHGSNAMAANGGTKVKMYAPSTWANGSSYAHLDYNTFNHTVNMLMVFEGSPGEAIHDPGPVTKGLLKDLGWGSGGTTSRSQIVGTWSSGIWYWNPATSAWTKTESSAPQGPIAIGDVTGDGKADIIACFSNGLWYQNASTLAWTKVDTSAPVKVAAGDITGDGRAEIVGTWSSGIWYWNPATSTWTKTESSAPQGPIAVGDIAGDKKADIIACYSSGLWYQNASTLAWIKVDAIAPSKVAAGDITGDGRAEIVGTWSDGIKYWNPVTSTLTKTESSLPQGPIAVGDVTGDGKADIVVCYSSGLWYQNGSTLQWTKVDNSVPSKVAVGNVTGN